MSADADAAVARGPVTRHLGLDLGGTNLKWTVVERDGDDWRVLDRGQVPTRSGGPDAIVPQLAEIGRTAIERWPAGRWDGDPDLDGRRRHPRALRPADRRDPLPREHPGAVGRLSGGRPGLGRPRRAGRADQRRPCVRPGRAPARGRSRRVLARRADPRDRRRRGDRGRRQGPPGPRRDGGRGRPPDDRSGRAVVQLRQPRLPRGVRPGRPDRRGVRDGDRGGGRRAGTERGRGRARGAPPGRAATSGSGSAT